jgi:hypothetical protein
MVLDKYRIDAENGVVSDCSGMRQWLCSGVLTELFCARCVHDF